jgi:tellurite resistance protein TehA-like permease
MSSPVAGGREAVRTLNPGYFALVMATGIVSVAMDEHREIGLSLALLWIGCAAYAVLVVLTAWRAAACRHELIADLRGPRRAFLLFTFVAASDVLGARFLIAGQHTTALVLLLVGWLAWLCLGYLVPWTALLGRVRRPILRDADATWFVWTVASQSVAVLSAALEPFVDEGRRELALLAVFSWSIGLFLYAATGLFVAARLLLYPLRPDDLTPPYWVAMGATAITVLAGAKIVEMADAPTVAATRGLAIGTSVVFWAFGTWLIPPLVAAGVWRHIVHRIPLRYEATLWSIVFPLGMYAVGAHYLGQADHLPFVTAIGADESWVALAAWAITFAAMLHHLARTLVAVPDS